MRKFSKQDVIDHLTRNTDGPVDKYVIIHRALKISRCHPESEISTNDVYLGLIESLEIIDGEPNGIIESSDRQYINNQEKNKLCQ